MTPGIFPAAHQDHVVTLTIPLQATRPIPVHVFPFSGELLAPFRVLSSLSKLQVAGSSRENALTFPVRAFSFRRPPVFCRSRVVLNLISPFGAALSFLVCYPE